MPIWAADAEIDEDLQEVDLTHAIGNYVQNGLYDDSSLFSNKFSGIISQHCFSAQPRIDEATLAAVQQQMAQEAAFAQIPDVVKGVSHAFFFHQSDFGSYD